MDEKFIAIYENDDGDVYKVENDNDCRPRFFPTAEDAEEYLRNFMNEEDVVITRAWISKMVRTAGSSTSLLWSDAA